MRAISASLFFCILGCVPVPNEQQKIGAGDSLELSFKKAPQGEMKLWNGDYKVNGAGQIALPMLGLFKVEGMTLEGAANAIEKTLLDRDIYRNPDLELQFPKAPFDG